MDVIETAHGSRDPPPCPKLLLRQPVVNCISARKSGAVARLIEGLLVGTGWDTPATGHYLITGPTKQGLVVTSVSKVTLVSD